MTMDRDTEQMLHQAEAGIEKATPDALQGVARFAVKYPLLVGALTYAGIALWGLVAKSMKHR